MSQQTRPDPPPKPTETRWALAFSAIGAIGALIAAAATIWVGFSAADISKKQTEMSEQQKSFDLAATLAPLMAASKDSEKHILALKILTAYSKMKYGALPNELLGVALVDYGTKNRTPVEAELQRMTCVLHDAFKNLAENSYDDSIRQRAQSVLEDAELNYSCERGVAKAMVAAGSQPGNSTSKPSTSAPSPPSGSPSQGPAPAPPASPAPTDTANLYTVIVASEPDKDAAQTQLNVVATKFKTAGIEFQACLRPPVRLPCWWGVDMGHAIPLADAHERLRKVRTAYPDAYLTHSRGEPEARKACPSEWTDLPPGTLAACAD
jgi:hypothetical protein